MITVNCVQCPNCLDIIYSRAHHDYMSCSCGQVVIDGGNLEDSYIRTTFSSNNSPPIFKLILPQIEETLYNDWNQNGNKFGRIKIKHQR
jgi:hypothetical protein